MSNNDKNDNNDNKVGNSGLNPNSSSNNSQKISVNDAGELNIVEPDLLEKIEKITQKDLTTCVTMKPEHGGGRKSRKQKKRGGKGYSMKKSGSKRSSMKKSSGKKSRKSRGKAKK